jgi:curved DNA-binding protein CbpA
MRNRRNYYRILHVQPEAPMEVIKASYRSMMTKMRLHPDLGGDHETAVLINAAYAVLGDPRRRQQYDQLLRERYPHVFRQARRAPAAEVHTDPTTSRQGAGQSGDASATAGGRCLFCNTRLAFAIRADSRCPCCDSPLTHAQGFGAASSKELFGRRAAPRLSKNGPLVLYPHWPHQGLAAELRDLSPAGVGFLAAAAVRLDQLVKITGATFDGIASVVSSRPAGRQYAVHARLLTVMFSAHTGTFVSARA